MLSRFTLNTQTPEQRLPQLYTYERPAEVKAYIANHLDLVPLLTKMQPKILSYFPGAYLSLDIEDIGNAGADEKLALVIIPPATENSANLAAKLHEVWWLASLDEAQSQLSISIFGEQ
jgi:hypothetical protein